MQEHEIRTLNERERANKGNEKAEKSSIRKRETTLGKLSQQEELPRGTPALDLPPRQEGEHGGEKPGVWKPPLGPLLRQGLLSSHALGL